MHLGVAKGFLILTVVVVLGALCMSIALSQGDYFEGFEGPFGQQYTLATLIVSCIAIGFAVISLFVWFYHRRSMFLGKDEDTEVLETKRTTRSRK